MRKKTVALGSLVSLLCATQVIAGGCFYKSGFLAGGHVGASFGKGTFNATDRINPALPVNSSSASGTARKTGVLFGALVGYRHVFNQDYTVGLNLEANLYGNSQLNKQLAFFPNPPPALLTNNSLKRTFTVMPSISFGKILCSRWHASLGLGLPISSFKQQYSFIPGPVIASGATGNSSNTKMGIAPIVGVEYATSQNVSMFGNVSYEVYSKLNKTYNLNIPGANPASYSTSNKATFWNIKVGAVYKF